VTAPTPEQQVEFLAKLQRLLIEGGFVATYKHALLLALADLSVEMGDDSGAPLVLPVSAIAEKFTAYYWRQARPYGGGVILKQNTGKQAAVVRLVADAHARAGGLLPAAKADPKVWARLVGGVGEVVKKMPLWKLQRVGKKEVLDFLYANALSGDSIELREGIAFCFRRFHGLIEDLVRGAWVRFVRGMKENQSVLGDTVNLDEFLFGSERTDLSAYRPILTEVQHGTCFYCERRIGADGAVDHFIPWSRYPVDLGHNFVLADGRCNGSKGDRLAAGPHLERWCRRNRDQGTVLDEAFTEAKIVADRVASTRITRWAYEQVESTRGLVWVSADVKADWLVPLDKRWRDLLNDAA
jgi:hypothetical protein